jgi:hypothetical protein
MPQPSMSCSFWFAHREIEFVPFCQAPAATAIARALPLDCGRDQDAPPQTAIDKINALRHRAEPGGRREQICFHNRLHLADSFFIGGIGLILVPVSIAFKRSRETILLPPFRIGPH